MKILLLILFFPFFSRPNTFCSIIFNEGCTCFVNFEKLQNIRDVCNNCTAQLTMASCSWWSRANRQKLLSWPIGIDLGKFFFFHVVGRLFNGKQKQNIKSWWTKETSRDYMPALSYQMPEIFEAIMGLQSEVYTISVHS